MVTMTMTVTMTMVMVMKVARTRQKWKVHLKDGVMRINGKDHLFHTAVGDMLF